MLRLCSAAMNNQMRSILRYLGVRKMPAMRLTWRLSPPGCAHRASVTLSPVRKHVLNTCIPREGLISISRSRKWWSAPSNGMHLPKWRVFRRRHVGRLANWNMLSQCWPRSMDAARQPRLRHLGCERADKSRSSKINPLPTFTILPSHSPVTTPATSCSVTIPSQHVQATSASGPGIALWKIDPIPHGYNNAAIINCSQRFCQTRDTLQVDRVPPA